MHTVTSSTGLSEATPLLQVDEAATSEHELLYNRFSKRQKRVIVTLISIAGLTPLFISGSFVPSIPQIARDLHTTGPMINLAISLSILSNAIGSLLWSSYSSYYGRKPVYLLSLAIQCAGSFGVGYAKTVTQLLVLRVVQAFGSSSGLSVGMGVIGDIYKMDERGAAAGIFFAAVLLGSALAPFVGGVTGYYFSWRILQYGFGVYAFVALIMTAFLQPETSHPGSLGIEKARRRGERPGFVVLNPFRSMLLMKSPNVSLISLAGSLALLTDYVMITPVAFTIGAKYNLSNEAIIGAICVPTGLGNTFGAPISGAFSDRILIKRRKRRGSTWVPEDRLRARLVGAGILVPCSVLFSGLLTRYVCGTVGLVLNCVCFFINGIGVDFVLSPSAAYNVDILHDRSAEVTAASGAFRSIFISASVALILPTINACGVAVTNGLAAVGAWIGFGLILSVIKYGDRMRAWADRGTSVGPDATARGVLVPADVSAMSMECRPDATSQHSCYAKLSSIPIHAQ